jgi:hypothetical protein
MGWLSTSRSCRHERNEPLRSNDSGSAARDLFNRIDHPRIAIWREDLQQFEKNCAAKDDPTNERVTTWIPARKQQAQNCKCADTFQYNISGRLRCR